MHREQLLDLLYDYRPRFMEEVSFVRRAIELISQEEYIFERQMPIHVTASTWVVSPDREKVLLLPHKKSNQWFQPGGHADGDPDVLSVALRECAEETGIDAAQIRLIQPQIFDVDLHSVPKIGAIEAHGHIDIRFAVEIDDRLPIPGNNESHAVAWFTLRDVMHVSRIRSTWRMLEKTRALRNPVAVMRERYPEYA
jgi:8-oxo-dGTP pyrophosphatase MutT (NUDIX family)